MGELHPQNQFVEHKVKLLLKIFLVLFSVIGTMSIIRIIDNDYLQAGIDFLFLIIVLYGYYKLKTDSSYYKKITRFVFFTAFFASLFLVINHPETPIRFIWLSTVVYMVFYLFDEREASLWLLGIGIIVFACFFLHVDGFHISFVDFLIWIMNLLVVLMIAHWYADIEKLVTQKLLEIQKMLSEEVEKKTRELERKKSELEKKTQELEVLNETLEEKIRIKTEKNRQQEKMLFQQARHAQMGEMISMIAHQWRQPLNAIAAVNATVKLKNDLGVCEQTFVNEKTRLISEHVQHLSSTIDDFRNFFKLDKNKEVRSTTQIIRDTLRLAESALESKLIHVSEEIVQECTILTYPNEVVHVLLNLIKNAEDAIVIRKIDRPFIVVRTTQEGEYAVIEVEDNAGGIELDIMEKIFDPYFTTKENSDGTGLGLYMSKTIIEDHCNGKIEIKNGSSGAVFRLIFPLHHTTHR
ncbi:histidine kinase [hydrothermal vent metagenome]|uniref:Histidine kinase n=1 Tax=hydrothermal vent metagenome TaxID=652676 RepID=A0A1W1E7K8_9ZZZZ